SKPRATVPISTDLDRCFRPNAFSGKFLIGGIGSVEDDSSSQRFAFGMGQRLGQLHIGRGQRAEHVLPSVYSTTLTIESFPHCPRPFAHALTSHQVARQSGHGSREPRTISRSNDAAALVTQD